MKGDKIPIGTFSYIAHIPQKALRIYDEKGLPVPAGPTRELYINDPAEVPEEELLTGVMIPVRKG
ncbi:MerR family transcriptional regulator [Methanoplanus limicola]|uniref:GyrI-like small molecule binding domain-containing protein n=1 Tax=Methanoplanus limicola DSM 2279 TaxID=937775 RepID=H1Z0M6_9EURY|nr:hypothetical protein [Methanoplanus limicola]EHQ35283.1 hypothetical protein Metlim_1172 [Methanoplanus limicola DSM 2279]